MRFEGTLSTWNDERGFGFITPATGGQELFVHIKSFPAGTGRPRIGQALSFEVMHSPDGKKRALAVQYPSRTRSKPRRESAARWTLPRLLAIPVFVGLALYTAHRWGMNPLVPAFYGAASVLAMLVYAIDKSAAVQGRWRTSERTLHLLGLVGGWPGALIAQQWLRHKSSKTSFVAMFWVTVVLNIGLFVAWHAGLLSDFAANLGHPARY